MWLYRITYTFDSLKNHERSNYHLIFNLLDIPKSHLNEEHIKKVKTKAENAPKALKGSFSIPIEHILIRLSVNEIDNLDYSKIEKAINIIYGKNYQSCEIKSIFYNFATMPIEKLEDDYLEKVKKLTNNLLKVLESQESKPLNASVLLSLDEKDLTQEKISTVERMAKEIINKHKTLTKCNCHLYYDILIRYLLFATNKALTEFNIDLFSKIINCGEMDKFQFINAISITLHITKFPGLIIKDHHVKDIKQAIDKMVSAGKFKPIANPKKIYDLVYSKLQEITISTDEQLHTSTSS